MTLTLRGRRGCPTNASPDDIDTFLASLAYRKALPEVRAAIANVATFGERIVLRPHDLDRWRRSRSVFFSHMGPDRPRPPSRFYEFHHAGAAPQFCARIPPS
jgi:hypothetical protein